MAWSQDGSILAISYSNGQVIFYDVMASIVTSVRRYDLPSQEGVGTDVFNADNSLAALIFSSDRVKKHTQ
jgi:WD40 repeat protein